MSTERPLHQSETLLANAMRLAQQGDAEAYRAVLEAVEALVKVYVKKALKRMSFEDANLCEDVTQEILLAIHLKRHTYDATQMFTPWLFAIARYKVIDFGRRQIKTNSSLNIEDFEESLATEIFSEVGAERDLKSLVESLPPRSRELLELVKIEGLTVAEAAARMQMSESAVKVSIHRSLKFLKNRFMAGDAK